MTQKKNNLEKYFDTSKVSWLKSGGKIKNYIKIYDVNQIDEVLAFNENLNDQILTIGNFSNLLIKSNGFNGIGLNGTCKAVQASLNNKMGNLDFSNPDCLANAT